jgi:hypothetical protein
VTSWVSHDVDARWAAFLIDATPRPIVLLDERLRIEGGFDDVASKEAWLGGRISWSTPLDSALSALLPAGGRAHTDRELTVTELVPISAGFQCRPAGRPLSVTRGGNAR